MQVKAVKVWLVVCPKCDEEYHLMEEEFSGNKTFWTCLKCGLEFDVVLDN